MPEILEVEAYRRAASRALDRPVVEVVAPDPWYLKGIDGTDLAVLEGGRLTAARRHGKLLVLEHESGADIGVRFGMTGTLVVDDEAAIERLEYGPSRHDRAWERFALRFDDGGSLVVRDPRRLGGISLAPDLDALGPDAWRLTRGQLGAALAGSGAPLKARLLDQARVAGVGNLLADEILWRAGLRPTRPAGGLAPAEVRRLHRHLRATLEDLDARGGSHTGDLMPHRTAGGRCPRDGAALERSTVGGRTTWWCPAHQR